MERNPYTVIKMLSGLERLVERALMSDQPYYPGLEGVVAGETSISTIEEGLRYSGYSIEELAESSSVPAVAYLLLHVE